MLRVTSTLWIEWRRAFAKASMLFLSKQSVEYNVIKTEVKKSFTIIVWYAASAVANALQCSAEATDAHT